MTRRMMLAALALAFGGLVSPLQAIEMFTNFNNGTELGTRPYGIEIMSPVRYHAYPQGRWFGGPRSGCDNSGYAESPPAGSAPTADAAPATRPPQLGGEAPVEIRAQTAEPAAKSGAPDSEDHWIRSINFLPPTQTN